MGTSFFTQWFSDRAINAICWTLIHSLWIGLIVAVFAGLLIALTNRSSANLRYRLLFGLLALFVVSTGMVLWYELNNNHPLTVEARPAAEIYERKVTIISPDTVSHTVIGHSFADQLTGFFNRQAGWIFLAWLLCFALKSVKMIGGLLYVHRIRHQNIHSVGEEWRGKIILFGEKLGIRRKVMLLQSGLVKVPATIGFFKPVILLPLGLLLQLPPGQIDTILWHELAHIRRRDYLVNLVQSVVEAVFFFNPALLWISALIREEREACCDDMVLANVSQKGSYLEALLTFNQYADTPVGHAMALGLGRGQLTRRLKRMINQENKKLSRAEKIILLAGIMLLSAFSFMPKANSEIKRSATYLKKNILAMVSSTQPKALAAQPASKLSVAPALRQSYTATVEPVAKDSLVGRDTTIKFTSIIYLHNSHDTTNNEMNALDDKGNNYHLKVADNRITFLEINGKAIAADQLNNYQGLLKQINRAIDEKRNLKFARVERFKRTENEGRLREMALYDSAHQRELKMKLFDKNDSISPKWKSYKLDAMARMKRFPRKRLMLRDDSPAFKYKMDSLPRMTRLFRKKLMLSGDTSLESKYRLDTLSRMKRLLRKRMMMPGDTGLVFKKMQGRRFKENKAWQKQRATMMTDKNLVFKKRRDTMFMKMIGRRKQKDSLFFQRVEERESVVKETMKDIIADLVTEKIVKDKNDLQWFGLTDTELIVNGVKQPADIHQKLKEKYMRNPEIGFYYGPVQMHGMGYFYGKEDL